MSDSLRRIYNSIDCLFDRNAITEDLHFTKDDAHSTLPRTALQAFQAVKSFVNNLDKKAVLKAIVSQQGVDLDGKNAHWEFFFDLINKRAQLVCNWKLNWDDKLDNYTSAKIEFKITPFPSMNSPLRQMVKEGKLLNQQLISMWKQEMNRRPNLPYKFRDTNLIIKDFTQQGLDVNQIEFSLSTGQDQTGKLCWLAQTKRKNYYAIFKE